MTLGPHTIVVHRDATAGEDEYGDDLPAAQSSTPIAGCSVQPGRGRELPILDREATTTAYTVWAPLDFEVLDTDRITWDGTPSMTYRVDGQVAYWRFTPGHQVIPLAVVTG